ncbi:MAG: hypothetical protein GY820_12465 [Gammaproteobacteria bacterium]|nr:hypothetical protein [Gammaproteobacteria bacterium]
MDTKNPQNVSNGTLEQNLGFIMVGAVAPNHNMFENLQCAFLKIRIALALARMNLAKRRFTQI